MARYFIWASVVTCLPLYIHYLLSSRKFSSNAARVWYTYLSILKEGIMVKRASITGILALSMWAFVLCMNGFCEDNEANVLEKGTETTSEIVNNYECPISEDDIDPATAIAVEYKGKVYRLCCPACVKHFQKYPEKFSQKILNK